MVKGGPGDGQRGRGYADRVGGGGQRTADHLTTSRGEGAKLLRRVTLKRT